MAQPVSGCGVEIERFFLSRIHFTILRTNVRRTGHKLNGRSKILPSSFLPSFWIRHTRTCRFEASEISNMQWRKRTILSLLFCDEKLSSIVSASSYTLSPIGSKGYPRTSSALRTGYPPRGGHDVAAALDEGVLEHTTKEEDEATENVDFTPYDKNEEQTEFLNSVIKTSVFVGELSDNLSSDLISSFKPFKYKKGTVLCYEGDNEAESMYVVEDGECSVFVEGAKLPEPYGTMSRGSIIGENSLLYDTPRAATVIAKTDIRVFCLDKEAFKHFLHRIPAKEEDIKQQITKIDKVIDQVSGLRTKYGGDVIQKFKPSRRWLWSRWTGTILQHAWKTAVANMILSFLVVTFSTYIAKPEWKIGMLPDRANVLISRMLGLDEAWKYVMNLTTFTLTFFLTQAYSLWRNIYNTARIVQGHLSDINLLLASSAERNRNGLYTERAKDLLEDVARYSRLYHVFMWAAFSDKLNILLTDLGIRRMIGRGVISRHQYEALQQLDPEILPQHACIVWIISRSLKGMKDGAVPDDVALRDKIYERSLELQGHFAGVASQLAGKIPLAYAHFVQILVDTFLLLAPFALYSELGIWSIPAVGILTLFYSGLLDLAKILLHPLGNHGDTYDDSVNMDLAVIIRESNAGSTRWMNGGKVLPF